MEPDLVFRLIWGVVAVLGGLALIGFRTRIADRVRAERSARGEVAGAVTPMTQRPAALAVAGVLFLVVGGVVLWFALGDLAAPAL